MFDTELQELLGESFFREQLKKDGKDLLLFPGYGAGYDKTLRLYNAHCVPEIHFDNFFIEDLNYNEQDQVYQLTCDTYVTEDDVSVSSVYIYFSHAEHTVSLSRADEMGFIESPWYHLLDISRIIMNKYILSADYLNDTEKRLLPLIAEICNLFHWIEIPEEYLETKFCVLKEYVTKFHYTKLLSLLKKLENTKNNKRRNVISSKIINLLNMQEHEPLWREIYQLLLTSQNGYEHRVEQLCPSEILYESRNAIQQYMEANGYQGEYPDFIKTGTLAHIHLTESYNVSYVVGFEKNVIYHIHCIEEFSTDHLSIQFLCGTKLLKKNESMGDIYSCTFNAKGRRIFNIINYIARIDDYDKDTENKRLQMYVKAAGKKAELLKLTKEERKEISPFDVSYIKLFCYIFIVLGFLFSVYLNIGLQLLTVIICIVVSQPEFIPVILFDTIWIELFFLTWLLFGGILGIVTILAKRK